MITVHVRNEQHEKFPLGNICATPGAIEALRSNVQQDEAIQIRAAVLTYELVQRHVMGDWGEIDAEDAQANEDALRDGCRVLSAYKLQDGTRLWIITEGDRSVTTILLPEEY